MGICSPYSAQKHSRIREIDSLRVMLNTADIQCYKNGRCNNTQRSTKFIFAIAQCRVLGNVIYWCGKWCKSGEMEISSTCSYGSNV